jgi:hypothetical protein
MAEEDAKQLLTSTLKVVRFCNIGNNLLDQKQTQYWKGAQHRFIYLPLSVFLGESFDLSYINQT